MNRPLLGISMGDPFGNGPEITVRALSDAAVYDRCRPLVVGDETSMRYALKVAEKIHGIKLELNVVDSPAEGKYTYGTVDLMDLGLTTGWNEVYLPFASGTKYDGSTGPVDLSAINYIRIYGGFATADWFGFDKLEATMVKP